MRQLKIAKQVTNRDTASLDKYLQEISKMPMIRPEEEVELSQRIKLGDQQALERLVGANLRFVVSVAKQYQNQGLTLSDLINEGNLGLIKSANRFDETRGFKFISYAVWWIRQSILQALAEHARVVRLPLNKIGALNKVNRAYSSLEQEFEREPTVSELSESLSMNMNDVKESLQHSFKHISFDAPIQDGEDTTMIEMMRGSDFFKPDREMLVESLREEIEICLSSLTKRESEVLRSFFGLNGVSPLSLEEIGEEMDLTRERVRQIKEKGLRKLKQMQRNRQLRTYLGT
jgi:RNA polymerase primary sigma factor